MKKKKEVIVGRCGCAAVGGRYHEYGGVYYGTISDTAGTAGPVAPHGNFGNREGIRIAAKANGDYLEREGRRAKRSWKARRRGRQAKNVFVTNFVSHAKVVSGQ